MVLYDVFDDALVCLVLRGHDVFVVEQYLVFFLRVFFLVPFVYSILDGVVDFCVGVAVVNEYLCDSF